AIQEDHPYGTFIKYDEDLEKLSVSYENLIYVSSRLGLFNYRDNVIHIKGKIIEMITHRQFQDSLKDYIKEEEADDYEKLCNVFEKFMKENTKYVTTRLNILPDEEARFVRDNKDNTYIFYLNGFVEVSSLGIELKDYDDLDGYIWNTQILNRNFIYSDNSDCDFKNFVHNVSGKDSKRYISITSALGYLMNDYKDPSYSPAVILNDEVISDHPEGGTGKGLLINALKYFKKSVSFDGKTFSFDKSFVYQKINLDTKIMAFDDVNKNFDFEKLFSVISEGIDVEKKNRDAFKIPFEDSPKITITTNYAMSGQGNSNDRRRFELELARHYSKEHTPFDEFGKLLFTGWDDKEWNAFDNFMAECAMHYILQGLVQQELIHLPEKKLIAQTSSTFIDFINDWLEDHNNNPFGQISRIIMYNEFMHENQKSKLTSNSFYKWCRIFFEFKKINFEEKRGAGGDRQFLFI
nr:hypothetical protein [Pseudopedobacter sp.]